MNLSSMGSARPYANAMDNTTARLRKAFKYPTDGDGDEDHEEMDEEGKNKFPASISLFLLKTVR